MSITYANYLHLDRLLGAQAPLSEGPEHDEMLFIVIHQVYELWFKQILHETGRLQTDLEAGRGPQGFASLGRVRTILKTLVSQVDILETMTPLSFLSFRSRLEAASGFQSVQFREVEVRFGFRRREALSSPHYTAEELARLEAALQRWSVWRSFLELLVRRGYEVPASSLDAPLEQPTREDAGLHELLIGVYRSDPEIAQICERMVDLDEGLQEWRYRHVKMVERTIGTRQGTGGSDGAAYLRSTLFRPLFPDLWAIRASL